MNTQSAAQSAAASATSAAASAAAAATTLENTVNVFGLPSEAAAQKYNIENDAGVKAALSASYDHSGAVSADTQAGATVAAQITNASTAATAYQGVVAIPSTLSTSTDERARTSDLTLAEGRLVVDWRNQVGTLSNFAQRGALQLTKIFGANTVDPPEANADNGSLLAVDVLLTGGAGGNGTGVIHGENCAGYFGIQRQAESTRSAWGLNVLATTYAPPSSTYHTMGLEIDINNNGGVDAGADDICDGLTVFTAGASDARFGAWFTSARSDGAGDGTASRWLDGVHISGVCSRAALAIDAGSAAFDSENMLGIMCQPPAHFDDYVRAGRLEMSSAQYDALPDYGAHVWRSTIPGQGVQTVGQLEANGKLTLQSWTADAPKVTAGGVATDIDLALTPKGAGALDLGGVTGTVAPAAGGAGALPATPAGYLTVKVNGAARKVAYY